MALSVLDRPRGYKLSSTANTTYSIISNGYGTAVLSGGSGLATGSRIYIYNSFTSYVGFWYITAYGPSQFRLQRYPGADYLTHTQDHNNVTVYPSVGNVDYSCIHLPIVYTISSDVWPTNTSDTIRNIVGFANDSGLVRITLDGSIDLQALDFLKITNTSEDDLDGPFQIITKYSATQYTIDAPYSIAQDSPYTYASATAQKYYNNYAASIRIYGGLRNTHAWAELKPYELITTVKVIPNTDGLIKVNVADILKEKTGILNNRPNYDSMPYDLDRFCEFYIEYAEQYDDGNGTEVETFTGAYQSDFDFFQGVAVDAKLQFKNRYSGFLAEYVYADASNLGMFLSDGEPTYFKDRYFDVSILAEPLATNSSLRANLVNFDSTGNAIDAGPIVSDYPIEGGNRAVYRLPLTVAVSGINLAAYSFTLYISRVTPSDTQITETKRFLISQLCEPQQLYLTWKNHLGGFNYWLFTDYKDYSIDIAGVQEREKNINPNWPQSYNEHEDSITQETYRTSANRLTVRAENLTKEQVEFIAGIKVSSLVQQMTSKYDRRTLLIDASSFRKRTDNEGLSSIEFDARYTDNLPSQSL